MLPVEVSHSVEWEDFSEFQIWKNVEESQRLAIRDGESYDSLWMACLWAENRCQDRM
jgi:hypothetical protein